MRDNHDPTTHDLLLRPRGPLLVRDGRPFAALPGARAVSLPWPLPGTLAGALRTAIGESLGFPWRDHGPSGGPARARRISIAGPLGLARRHGAWEVLLPAPADALITLAPDAEVPTLHPLFPWSELQDGAGCDLPHPALRPLRVLGVGKPVPDNCWWPLDAVADWLRGALTAPPMGILGHPERETRVHVAIAPTTETAREGKLFTTEGLVFSDVPTTEVAGADDSVGRTPERALLCRLVESEGWSASAVSFVPFGGERRLTELHAPAPAGLWPALPPALLSDLVGADTLRLLLVTPAAFTAGWKPAWLDGRLEGSPPGIPVRLRLEAAAVGRRIPVSGWDLMTGQAKAARWLAPAGAVYFFRVLDGPLSASQIEALWMAPLSDHEQDRIDGYGLALPGVWFEQQDATP